MIRSVSFIVTLLVLLLGTAVGAPVFGPENAGLRLALDVVPGAEEGASVVTLILKNTGAEPRTLVANFPYEDGATYADYLPETVTFVTFPEVMPNMAQTGGVARTSAQPEQTLAPGEELKVSWTSKQWLLKPKDPNGGVTFVAPGLYGVRVQTTLQLKDGKRVRLHTPEVPYSFKSEGMPKQPTALVGMGDQAAGAVTIHAGSIELLEVGDVFRVQHGLSAAWTLTVTEVSEHSSKCAVELRKAEGTQENIPALPPTGTKARLVKLAAK